MPINSLATFWRIRAIDQSGGTHPTGWVSGQEFQTTAAQWQNMYNAEVTAYNNEVAIYNDMVSQRDTWFSRANNAWGATRAWNNGESWEAAYFRVFTDRYNQGYGDGVAAAKPADLWQAYITAPGGVAGPSQSTILTLPFTGWYFAVASAVGGEFSASWQLAVEMHVGGDVFAENYGTSAKPAHPQFDDSYVRVYMAARFYSAGTQAWFYAINAYSSGGGTSGANNEMIVAFIPTPANPH